MIVGSNQPYLFLYIGYWQLMNLADTYVISDSMQYISKGYINRNYIQVNHNRHLFTLSAAGVHAETLINEVKVGNNRKKLVKSVFHSYKKAPHFDTVYPFVESLLLYEEDNMARYVGHTMEGVAHYLDMKAEFIYLSELQGETTLMAEDRTVDICKRLDADYYINAIGGQQLYNKDRFLKEGITLQFLKTNENLCYQQFNGEFISNLSIIDVLMFNTKDEIKQLLQEYTLV